MRAQSADTAAPPQSQGLGQTDRLLIPVTPFSESDWQVAFNTQQIKGRMEVRLSDSRIDILTEDYAIEVDRVSKYLEGINQALRYAEASGVSPALPFTLTAIQTHWNYSLKPNRFVKNPK